MPYIEFKTNVKVEDKNQLKSSFGNLISIIPNKTEARTMVSIQDEFDLYFGGSDSPCAIVETRVNLNTDHSKDKEYCDQVIEMISKELHVPINRIYAIVDEKDFWTSRT